MTIKPWHRLIALSRDITADVERWDVTLNFSGHEVRLPRAYIARFLEEFAALDAEMEQWEQTKRAADGDS